MTPVGRRLALRLLLPAAALAGPFASAEPAEEPPATPAAAPPDAREAAAEAAPPIDVAAILSGELTEDDYQESQLCIAPRDLDTIEVLGERLVLFHGRRGEIWLNQLDSRCLGLEPEMLLDLRSYGGNFCRLDRFRATPRFNAFLYVTAECRLGRFETITEPHAQALRAAVAERGQAEDRSRNEPISELTRDGQRIKVAD